MAQFGPDGPNDAMIARLQGALAAGEPVSGADAVFYTHELTEADLMEQGMPYEQAHAEALAKYGVSPFAVYAPEVVTQFAQELSPGFQTFWGLG